MDNNNYFPYKILKIISHSNLIYKYYWLKIIYKNIIFKHSLNFKIIFILDLLNK